MIKVEISEKRWGRGETGGYLRNADGLQCCLGFICEMAGLEKYMDVEYAYERGKNNGYPHNAVQLYWDDKPEMRGQVPELLQELVGIPARDNGLVYPDYSQLSHQLALVNDDRTLSDEHRKERLTAIAARGGYEFVFVE